MKRLTFTTESGAPISVTKAHIGLRILYRLPNQAVLSEGEIVEVSPEGNYFRTGKAWLANRPGSVLAVLSKNGPSKRKSAFEEEK